MSASDPYSRSFLDAARVVRAQLLGLYPSEPLSPYSLSPYSFFVPSFEDPNGRDGEWPEVISLPHEAVEHDGYEVPAFEGDVERLAWERARAERGR